MMSRANSLDSITSMRREYSDQEMISRPPSAASIRDFNKSVENLDFNQTNLPTAAAAAAAIAVTTSVVAPLNAAQRAVLAKRNAKIQSVKPKVTTTTTTTTTKTPLNAAQKAVLAKRNVKKKEEKIVLEPPPEATVAAATASSVEAKRQSSTAERLLERAKATASAAVHPIVSAVRATFPDENLNPAEIAVITRRKGLTPVPPGPPLNAAQKAVLAKKNKSVVVSSVSSAAAAASTSSASSSRAPLNAAQKAVIAKSKKKPPTVSLTASIEKKSTIKKKIDAAKADSKNKREEVVARWQNKTDDVEMAIPLQTGKRKKSITKFKPGGEAKQKKEN